MQKAGSFLLLVLIFLTMMPLQQARAVDEINLGYFSDLAMDGYDAVDYFNQSKPVKGKKAYSYVWKQATWLFSSEANMKQFITTPEAFAPQYGGYCSNQMSLGNLSDIDPGVWRIIDKKLYLFGHDAGRVRWAGKTEQRISEADHHWRSYLIK